MSRADDKIIQEAKERRKRCEEYESTARANWLEDVKFANGDDLNGWQWNSTVWNARESDKRPSLTVNKCRQHVLMIVNDARQNKAALKFTPTGGRATYEAAQIMAGLARRIEYQSNASQAYDKATWDMAQGGIGYVRVVTRYSGDDSMNQDLYIDRVPDALSVFLDPDIEHYDGSDGKFGFIESKMLTDEAEKKYPVLKTTGRSEKPYDINDSIWHGSDYTLVAEYYRVVEETDRLHVLPDGSTMKESEAADAGEALAQLMPPPEPPVDENGMPLMGEDGLPVEPQPPSPVDMLRSMSTRSRALTSSKVEWFKIVGDKIVERADTVFDTIPIARAVGEETVIEGKLDRRGHVRAMRDPQRMYNYWNSAAVEFVALQTKSPFIGAAESIEGHEEKWETANTENWSVLTYNHKSDDGSELPPPRRAEPPVMAQAFMAGLKTADEQMMMVTGQYPAELGRPGNEVSGVAIQQRQRQGDTATYHYIDHLAQTIRYVGRLILQAAPRVYDTERVLKIMAQDGSQSDVHVDPALQDAHMTVPDPQPPEPNMQGQAPTPEEQAEENVKTLWNPAIGTYEVEADVGPSFGTQRQEAFNAFTQIVAQNKELMSVAGDLMFKNADFPGADEMAERLKRMLPPQALGGGPSPQVMQLQQQLQAVQQHAQQVLAQADKDAAALKQQLAQAQAQLKDKSDTLRVSALEKSGRISTSDYEAETRRLAVIKDADPDVGKVLARTMLTDMLGMPALPVIQAQQTSDAMHDAALARAQAFQDAHAQQLHPEPPTDEGALE